MSSPEALAAVTTALQSLFKKELSEASVTITAKPPSAARSSNTGDQLNIFLYSVRHSPAFRNEPLPNKTKKSGELAFPPLPLILKYLLTAYGKGDDEDIFGQILLGRTMSILHDHPLLSDSEINAAEIDAGLNNQFERIRITPDPLSLDDMSKLWSSFQAAEYRLSVGYEVSVVLIDSTRSGKAPLPVLKRGKDDRGVQAVPFPLPSLFGLRFPNQKTGAELGDTVTLLGKQLHMENTQIRFEHPLLKKPIEVPPAAVRKENRTDEMDVLIPSNFNGPVGCYSVCLLITTPDAPAMTSNGIFMPLAPKISAAPASAPAGNVELTITCTPQLRKEQQVQLLFGNQIISPDPLAVPVPDVLPSLKFTVNDAEKGTYIVRLRVDGVDSIPVDYLTVNPNDPTDKPPRFADNQKVTIS